MTPGGRNGRPLCRRNFPHGCQRARIDARPVGSGDLQHAASTQWFADLIDAPEFRHRNAGLPGYARHRVATRNLIIPQPGIALAAVCRRQLEKQGLRLASHRAGHINLGGARGVAHIALIRRVVRRKLLPAHADALGEQHEVRPRFGPDFRNLRRTCERRAGKP